MNTIEKFNFYASTPLFYGNIKNTQYNKSIYILYVAVNNDEMSIYYSFGIDSYILSFYKFDLNKNEVLTHGYHKEVNAGSSKYFENFSFLTIDNYLWFTNHDKIYKISNDNELEIVCDQKVNYMFRINNVLYICVIIYDELRINIINFETKDIYYTFNYPEFKSPNGILYFSTNDNLYIYIKGCKKMIQINIIKKTFNDHIEENKFLMDISTIRKISEYEFLYLDKSSIFIHDLKTRKSKEYINSDIEINDDFYLNFICRYRYDNKDYFLTFNGIYLLHSFKYGYTGKNYKNNMIKIGNSKENIKISLNILKERSNLYKNLFLDLNPTELNEHISENYIDINNYLKFINNKTFANDIDSLISLFKTCNYLEDISTEFLSYELVFHEKKLNNIQKSIELLYILFKSPYTVPYHQIIKNILIKYDKTELYNNFVNCDRDLYDNLFKFIILNSEFDIIKLY